MDAYELDLGLPPVPDRFLDRLLAQWAGEHRLAPDVMAAIRETVLATPLDLDFDWWWQALNPADSAFPDAGAASAATGTLTSDLSWAGQATSLFWSPSTPSAIPAYSPYLRL